MHWAVHKWDVLWPLSVTAWCFLMIVWKDGSHGISQWCCVCVWWWLKKQSHDTEILYSCFFSWWKYSSASRLLMTTCKYCIEKNERIWVTPLASIHKGLRQSTWGDAVGFRTVTKSPGKIIVTHSKTVFSLCFEFENRCCLVTSLGHSLVIRKRNFGEQTFRLKWKYMKICSCWKRLPAHIMHGNFLERR